jgi:hypothetical protein
MPLQQTEYAGPEHAVQVRQEVARQTAIMEGQLPYPAHFYILIEGDIAVDDLSARIKIPHDEMRVVARVKADPPIQRGQHREASILEDQCSFGQTTCSRDRAVTSRVQGCLCLVLQGPKVNSTLFGRAQN